MENFKEVINRMKDSISSFWGHAKEFVRAFSEPAKQDPTLEEAIENIENMTPKEKADLKDALMNETNNNVEEPKKEGRKRSTITHTETQEVSSLQRTVTKDDGNKGIDR